MKSFETVVTDFTPHFVKDQELQTKIKNDRQLLVKEKAKLLPLQEVSEDLMLEKDCLIEALREEIKNNFSLEKRYNRCHHAVFG